ncbi:amidase [Bordetella avium]|uniref:Amidase n=5 Tax=Bordetella avium TaxID=521 RepID=Q2KWI7_BORA1|nr:amidase [Bordetella avium]AZY53368.1 amidase [Bordetella avium]RIQ33847.1 amidase [Bordetella avium]RIQ52035.1 amidase [Bordetella avium]RIQ68226.1 amidase [Bordetella avium]CAJ50277.1 putative amidase [Bordetella avium 197N]
MNTIKALSAALAAGQTTSLQLVENALQRIADYRQQGGAAYTQVDAESALQAAHASDLARRAGYVPSALAGLPISIKDLFDVQGQVSTAGSRALDGAAPAVQDAPVVARLRQAGAILLGRTNMSEFAFSGLGLNPHYGTPRAPHDENRIAGGSTSGGAVTVARGMAVAALGTDTGGSIRIPSAFCGLTGFKPTASRVPRTGAVPLSSSLDSIGPLAASVGCCATFDAIIRGRLDGSAPEAASLKGLRLYITRDFVFDNIDPEVEQAFQTYVQNLARHGAILVPFDFPELRELPDINAAGGLTAAEAWAWHRRLLASEGDRYDPRVAVRIRRGAAISAADYLDVQAARARIQAIARHRLRDADGWLMPTVAVQPPLLAPLERDDDTFFATNGLVLRNPSTINFLDGCALSLPTDQAGIGLSVCGLHGQDARVLSVAAALEATRA